MFFGRCGGFVAWCWVFFGICFVVALVSLFVVGFFRFFELGPRDSRWGPDTKWGPKVGYAKPPTGTCRRGWVGDIVARIRLVT